LWSVAASSSAGGGWASGSGVGLANLTNKGGSTRVSLTPRRRIAWCLFSLIWPRCWVSKGYTGELPWAHYASRLLDQMGFCRARRCFFWPFGSGRSGTKLFYMFSSWHMFRPMTISYAENMMKIEIWELVIVWMHHYIAYLHYTFYNKKGRKHPDRSYIRIKILQLTERPKGNMQLHIGPWHL
jgi:hypothetical protein